MLQQLSKGLHEFGSVKDELIGSGMVKGRYASTLNNLTSVISQSTVSSSPVASSSFFPSTFTPLPSFGGDFSGTTRTSEATFEGKRQQVQIEGSSTIPTPALSPHLLRMKTTPTGKTNAFPSNKTNKTLLTVGWERNRFDSRWSRSHYQLDGRSSTRETQRIANSFFGIQ